MFSSARVRSENLMVNGPIIATTLEASNLETPVVIRIKSRTGGNRDENDLSVRKNCSSVLYIEIIIILR